MRLPLFAPSLKSAQTPGLQGASEHLIIQEGGIEAMEFLGFLVSPLSLLPLSLPLYWTGPARADVFHVNRPLL